MGPFNCCPKRRLYYSRCHLINGTPFTDSVWAKRVSTQYCSRTLGSSCEELMYLLAGGEGNFKFQSFTIVVVFVPGNRMRMVFSHWKSHGNQSEKFCTLTEMESSSVLSLGTVWICVPNTTNIVSIEFRNSLNLCSKHYKYRLQHGFFSAPCNLQKHSHAQPHEHSGIAYYPYCQVCQTLYHSVWYVKKKKKAGVNTHHTCNHGRERKRKKGRKKIKRLLQKHKETSACLWLHKT